MLGDSFCQRESEYMFVFEPIITDIWTNAHRDVACCFTTATKTQFEGKRFNALQLVLLPERLHLNWQIKLPQFLDRIPFYLHLLGRFVIEVHRSERMCVSAVH